MKLILAYFPFSCPFSFESFPFCLSLITYCVYSYRKTHTHAHTCTNIYLKHFLLAHLLCVLVIIHTHTVSLILVYSWCVFLISVIQSYYNDMNGLAAAAVIRTLFSSFTHPCECAFCAWMCVFVCDFFFCVVDG